MMFFFVVLGFKVRAYTSSHSTSPFFVMGIFEIGSCELFAQGWLPTVILQMSASWVARITGVSYQHPARIIIYISMLRKHLQLHVCYSTIYGN
jgi:hypothetical protein